MVIARRARARTLKRSLDQTTTSGGGGEMLVALFYIRARTRARSRAHHCNLLPSLPIVNGNLYAREERARACASTVGAMHVEVRAVLFLVHNLAIKFYCSTLLALSVNAPAAAAAADYRS